MKVKRALISVSDKTGLEDFVKELHALGVEIISTGGTAKTISSLGIPVTEVSDYTGFPEMLDGRVKTLNPKIHGGILALRNNPEHMNRLKEENILPIDMVVVNLYPFEQTVAKKGVKEEEAIENIDIGGPTMLRSAAKNFQSVAVLSSIEQYEPIIRELKSNGGEIESGTLRNLSQEVFRNTSQYDKAITDYFASQAQEEKSDILPNAIQVEFNKICNLRYGENPHQRAAFYSDAQEGIKGITGMEQIQGKELSFNNILDLNAAIEIVKEFDEPASVIVKHNNPCGAAVASTLEEAYLNALETDKMSAFGSIMGFNKPITVSLAETILKEAGFIECIVAPDYDDASLEVFSAKKNLRIIKLKDFFWDEEKSLVIKKVPGGALIQDTDRKQITKEDLKVVTDKKPSEAQIEALLFGCKIVKHVKSNAIVLSEGTKTVGIGAGQMSRVDSVIIAIRKAGDKARGAILASDAFFPKPDSIEEAHKAGISAIIQPGGSIKDQEVIDACNKLGIPMVLTGARHFKH